MSRMMLILFGALGLAISSIGAQSLADVAKKERERQQQSKTNGKTKGKVLTERDLRTNGGSTALSRRPAAEAQPDQNTAATDKEKRSSPQKDLKGDEYLGRHHADYTLLSLAPIKNERDKLDKRAEGIRHKLQGLEEEARKAGAPPSWVR